MPALLSSKYLGPEIFRGKIFRTFKDVEDLPPEDLEFLAREMHVQFTSKRETAEMVWLRANATQTVYHQTFEQRDMRIQRMTTGKKPTKRAPKPKSAVKVKKEGRGRPGNFAGKKIYLKVEENPRRKGTSGHKSFALIKNGMMVEDYAAAGGKLNDLRWDVKHKHVEVK